MLLLTAFLMVSGNDSLKLSVLTFLDKYLSSKNDSEGAEIEGLFESDFKSMDQIISNHVALHSNYKLKSKLDFPVVRQIQVLAENLKYRKNTGGFWMNYYVPFYSRIVEQDLLDGYIHLVMSAGTNDKIVKEVKKKSKDIKEFSEWANKAWLDPYSSVNLIFGEEANGLNKVFRDGSRVYGISNAENETPKTGKWVFIDDEGSLLSIGNFNQRGERHGKWTFFHDNGKISSTVFYKDAKEDGLLTDFDHFGYKSRELNFRNGLMNGPEIAFFASGDTSAMTINKEGEPEGRSFTRFPNGQTELDFTYIGGKINGVAHRYYDNGQMELEIEFKDGMKNGYFKSYHRNGKLKRTEQYTFDKSNGIVKEYYTNGQLSLEGTLKDDKYTGLVKEWFDDGTLREENNYDEKGRLQGISKIYAKDGHLYIKINYENDAMVSYVCYDKSGNTVSEGKISQGKLRYVLHYPEGGLKMEGTFVKGVRDGKWLFYDRYGILEQEETYSDGVLEGLMTEYFSNGKPDKVIEYKDGTQNGPYKEYYRTGNPYSKGTNKNGSAAGEWISYTPDGKVLYNNYFLDGDYQGWQVYNNVFGKTWHKVYYHKGAIIREQFYDTLGVMTQDLVLKGNSGILQSEWPNHQTRSKISIRNGSMHGDFLWYFFNGNKETVGKMFNGKRTGEWKHYYISGVLKETGSYDNGEKTGLWTEYDEAGQKLSETNYTHDKPDGKYTGFHSNGKPEIEGVYKNGKEEGEFRMYSNDGDLAYVTYFIEGGITGYSYNGADGKLVPVIPVQKGSIRLEAYFANGKKSVTGRYENGQYVDKWVWYNNSGGVEAESTFLLGGREGERLTYHPNGKIKLKEIYVNRLKEGISTEYNADGSLKAEISYYKDSEHGWTKLYDAKGKLMKSVYYYSGDAYAEK